MKEDLKPYLQKQGYLVDDCGTHSSDSVDYPDFAFAVAEKISSGEAWRGIIIDGAAGGEIHGQSAGAPPDANFSGGIPGVFEASSGGL